MHRFGSSLVVAMLIMILITSCSAGQAPPRDEQPAEITITPVDLFAGEAAKFKSFLGSMSGAFRVRYEGTKPAMKVELEIWKDGRKTGNAGSIYDLFFDPNNTGSQEVEIIVSMDMPYKENGPNETVVKLALQGDTGSTATTFTVPTDEKLSARGLIHYSEPATFRADEPFYVWGMEATSTNSIRPANFSPEGLSRLEWALLISISPDEQ